MMSERHCTLSRRALLAASAALPVAATPLAALASSDQENLVERARISIETMLRDPDFVVLADMIPRTHAVMIVPELLKAGFFIGGQGGTGVLLARLPNGSWSYPAFYSLAGGSFGLQIGGQVSELVLTVMRERGLNALLDRRVTLGADANVAVGPVGMGVDARTGMDMSSDMYAFSRNQGLFLGGALQGSVVSARDEWNASYYGAGATPRGILAGQYANHQADGLRRALG